MTHFTVLSALLWWSGTEHAISLSVPIVKFIETENRIVVARGWGEEEEVVV